MATGGLLAIFNAALYELSAARISTTDQLAHRAQVLRDQWPAARDAALRAHPWNFAIRFATLESPETAPSSGYGYDYPLPPEPFCLRVLELKDDDRSWEVFGNRLHTDAASPTIRYIARVEDTSVYDALFERLAALELADLAVAPLAKNRTVSERVADRLEKARAAARTVDSQEARRPKEQRSRLLDARLGYDSPSGN